MEMPRKIDPELPWGYWLRMIDTPRGTRFVDKAGKQWTSIRDVFWCSRLNFRPAGEPFKAEVLELLLSVLVSKARDDDDDRSDELYGNNQLFKTTFELWLEREGLFGSANGRTSSSREGASLEWSVAAGMPRYRMASEIGLTAEGLSVALMLGATRPQSVRAMRPTHLSVRKLLNLGIGPHPAEARMREVEVATANLPACFRRREIGGKHAIVLEKRDVEAPVPVIRTVWTQTFIDERSRNDLFEWLCKYLDRWESWATLAWGDSGSALTSHLLSLVVSSRPDVSS